MIKQTQKGFTFVEILAVVVLISILVAIAIPVVSKYVGKGKDTYNVSLKEQLELAGKSYFSHNKILLPVKKSNYIDKVATSYVLEPTLRTTNYLTKELVDSDGRNCQKSYVFVRQDENTTKNKYHACLICEDKNYSENDEYCKITDFEATEQPTCKEINISNYQRKNNGIYYNPEDIRMEKIKTEELSSIKIKNETTGSEKIIDLQNKKIDISSTNLVNYFPKSGGKTENGKYSITIFNNGALETKCIDNIVFDNENPTCELYYNNGKLGIEAKDNYSKEENLNTLINKKNVSSSEELKNKKADPISVSYGKYYGHVMDEAGNIGICEKNITQNTKEDPDPTPPQEPTTNPDPNPSSTDDTSPYCWFSKDSPSGWLKIGSSAKLEITCKSKGKDVVESTKKISTKNSLGTLTSANKKSNYVYTTTYTPKTNKTGTDNVKVGESFIKDSNGSNKVVWSKDLKIDTIKPVVTITFDSSKKKDGFYAKGVEVTLKCTDKGSGVKSVKLNSKTSNSSTLQVTNTKVGKEISYTGVCYDKAGNSNSVTKTINIKEWSKDKDCGCAQNVTCKEYNSCKNSNCSCDTYKRCKSCGCDTYSKWSKAGTSPRCSKCVGSGVGTKPASGCYTTTKTYSKTTCTGGAYKKCTTGVVGGQYTYKYCETENIYTRTCNTYKRCKSCGCSEYKSCKSKVCGCKTYNSCTSYKTCYHY